MKDNEELSRRLEEALDECARLRGENERLKALIGSLKAKPSRAKPLFEEPAIEGPVALAGSNIVLEKARKYEVIELDFDNTSDSEPLTGGKSDPNMLSNKTLAL